MNVQIIKDRRGKPEYVLLPVRVYEALRSQIERKLSDLEAGPDDADDYEPFDPADYLDNPVAVERMRAAVRQKALAKAMGVSQAYISKLEHAEHVTPETLERVRSTLKRLRKS